MGAGSRLFVTDTARGAAGGGHRLENFEGVQLL
jgi:hypothetical protein